MNIFTVSLYHGTGNKLKTTRDYKAAHPIKAAKLFMAELFPNDLLFELRAEQPTMQNDTLIQHWSAGTTASGQRVYISN